MKNHAVPDENPTPTNDSVLATLAQNNPVPEPGTASSAQANALVDSILADDQRFDRFQPSAPQPAPSRRWGSFAAAAAAVALVAGGIAVFNPTTTTPAQAAVQDASINTIQVSSGSAVTEISVSGSDQVDEMSASGRITVEFNGNDFSATAEVDRLDVSSEDEEFDQDLLSEAEFRYVDGTIYVTEDGESWMSAEAPAAISESMLTYLDGRNVLDLVSDITDVVEIGPDDVRGSVTHYQGVVDLSDPETANAEWFPPGLTQSERETITESVEGEVSLDIWIDDSGLVRRVTAEGDIASRENPAEGSAVFSVTTDLFDLGQGADIEAPEGDVQSFDINDLEDMDA